MTSKPTSDRLTIIMLLLAVVAVSATVTASRTGDQPIIYRTKTVRVIDINIKQIARTLLNPKAFKCWMGIDQAESHFNINAKNPNSSARGMAQLLSSTYKAIGMKFSSDPKAEFIAQVAYVSRHYGGNNGMCQAYRNEIQSHNY